MKNTLAVSLKVDIKSVRRAIAMITGEVLSDKEINKRFFERKPIAVDVENLLDETEAFQMCAAFTAIILGFENDEE